MTARDDLREVVIAAIFNASPEYQPPYRWSISDWVEKSVGQKADAILPIIAREVEAALTAARPAIERETREACAVIVESVTPLPANYSTGVIIAFNRRIKAIAAAIRSQP